MLHLKTDLFFVFQAGKGGELTHDETTIISGALDLTEKVSLLNALLPSSSAPSLVPMCLVHVKANLSIKD